MTNEELIFVFDELTRRADEGDTFAALCLDALQLFADYHHRSSPDDGGESAPIPFRRAA